ncbi:MAG TPA: CopD family protein, partial [Casimicrobiaceae bacterium]|nr:CopD family protein [Casimicrobiaceae bacterium]
MRTAVAVFQEIVQAIQDTVPSVAQPGAAGAPGGPGGPPRGFSLTKAFFELLQFAGTFLAIGAVGFRFGVVRQIRGMSDEAKTILRADNAALLGLFGVVLMGLSYLGAPYIDSIVNHKTFAAALPKNAAQFEFRMTMLTLALAGFALVRATSSVSWTLAAVGTLAVVLQPLITGRFGGKVNAVHILAASTWLGTLLVLTLIGIRGMMRNATAGALRAELVADLVNSFSPLALVAASVVAISGATTAWLHLKRVSSIWTTSYGIALVVKLALVLVVVMLGAWNWRRVRPSLGGEGSEKVIRKSATTELTFAALVLIATSVL